MTLLKRVKTPLDAFLVKLPKHYRAVQSEVFKDLKYIINDNEKTLTIYTPENGIITLPISALKILIPELWETYQMQCTNNVESDYEGLKNGLR